MNWNDAIKDFNNYLKIERGFSINSIYSYEKDIKKFKDFINESKSPIKINSDDIKEFLNVISKVLNSSSQSRIISGLRSFFEFMIFEKYITHNPLRLIESPKTSRKLPDTLSTNEIDELISNIDLSKEQGERNYAIIELLYGCGLRVSELVELKISDLFFEENFIKVTGKGNKQRLIPIGNITKNKVTLYLENSRNNIKVIQSFKDHVFLNRRGKKLTRAMIFTIIKQLAESQISINQFRHTHLDIHLPLIY